MANRNLKQRITYYKAYWINKFTVFANNLDDLSYSDDQKTFYL